MDEQQKGRILELAKDWFRNSVVPNHIKNTRFRIISAIWK
jgi:hypothetical protein